MWDRLVGRLRAHRRGRLLRRHAVPDALWATTLERYPFLAARPAEQLQRLRESTSLFLAEKEFAAAGGLQLTDEIAVAVAAQACLPVLELGLAAYDDFVGIVVHPDEVVARREVVDDDGIVHHYDETLSGEAMPGGPVMLSWYDVAAAGPLEDGGAYNVVIHEFAHVLDMRDGLADGLPPIDDPALRAEWPAALDEAFATHANAVDADRPTRLDPYGAEGPEEFFATSTESFFIDPEGLRQAHPRWYEALRRFYRQDPLADAARAGG